MTKKKKGKTKGRKLSSGQLQREVLNLFRRSPKKQLNPKQVSKKLKVSNNKDSITYALEKLVEAGELLAKGDYKFKLNRAAGPAAARQRQEYEGFVDMTKSGDAYIVCEGVEDDIHVSAKYLNTALHGDRVRIRTWTPRGRRRPEGEVLQVLERASEHFLGTLWIYPKYAIVVPEGKVPVDILVPLTKTLGANDGDKVVVKIEQWAGGEQPSPSGRVTTVLGQAGSHDIEMKAILINNGFDLAFPDEVLQESEKLPGDIPREEVAERLDLREVTTFTIDPENAKDFDDALSIRYLDNGDCEIGVHIADVSHYVRPGMSLDGEAFERSTSVYLVDRVLPMLPERLSNELCSLRPREDKLTFSAIFVFNKNDRIIHRWFGKTIIHSDRRFTYEEAQAVLDSGEGDFAQELRALNRLAHKLRHERFKKGAINFETDEVNFRLDEAGSPVAVYIKERKDAHLLIEDFMLLANREVASFIAKKGEQEEIPFIYRVHDEPNPDKVAELSTFAREMGFEMNIASPKDIARSYNQLIEAARREPRLKLLEPIAIRTMSKAAYSSNNVGHYGLAFDNYTHFTSPIRRYSDVLAHRILEKNIGKGQYHRVDKEKLEEKCKHISMQERKAMDAERESVKYKQVEFMEKHIGEIFSGYISGIIERGFFVELDENQCEGMVAFTEMDEYFETMGGGLRVRGVRTGKILRMGDRVRVRILRTDLGRRQIDFGWEGEEISEKSDRRSPNSQSKAETPKTEQSGKKSRNTRTGRSKSSRGQTTKSKARTSRQKESKSSDPGRTSRKSKKRKA